MFNHLIGLHEGLENFKVFEREAVRAIILEADRILMIQSDMGDYKLPGGGVEKGESHEMAIKREVAEETGSIVNDVKRYLGQVTERRLDLYEEDQIFEMVSHYYSCDISDNKVPLQLDDYEMKLNFQPVWIPLSEAIRVNETLLNTREGKDSSWLYRELFVLKNIIEKYRV